MKKIIVAISIVFIGASSLFAQQKGNIQNEKTLFVQAQLGKDVKLSIDLKKYDLNTIGKLKDDLYQFNKNEKIKLIELDEFNKILTVTYGIKMTENEFLQVFYENKVSFLAKDKPNTSVEQ
ncbi:MAG: hypothetical protein IT232_10510 [Flavobacteriales bacterium]|nr:hypothetical protein [Flavobacteriales bacterium]